jgi:hypothetical protein
VGIQKSSSAGINFNYSIFEEIIEHLEYEDLALWAVIARNIWFRRNSVVHGGAFSSPEKVIREATTSLEEFKAANLRDTEDMIMQQRTSPVSWRRLKG